MPEPAKRDDPGELPPFPLVGRFDLVGLGVGLLLGALLFLVGLSVWLCLVFAAATTNLLAYVLRRRAGVPQATLWQRARHRRSS